MKSERDQKARKRLIKSAIYDYYHKFVCNLGINTLLSYRSFHFFS